MIWAIILAAGESKRMGEPKMLLPFGDKTIIETVIDRVLPAKVDKIMVVTGARRAEIEEVLKPLPVKVVFNPSYKTGMLSSVQAGFKALPEDADAVLILLGDQPFVPTAVMDAVVEEYKSSNKRMVVPIHTGLRGHPLLIDMRYRDEIQRLDHEVGLRGLLHKHPQDVHELKVEDASILRDLDDMEDYQTELSRKH